jgi:alpha-D-xyloside xylohydrolase
MKFTDGNWFKRQGVHMLHPVETQERAVTTTTLSLFAATAPVINRGSGINSSLLEIRLSAPFADVIRVQIFHYRGAQDRGPHFQVHNDPNATVVIEDHDDQTLFCSDRLTAMIHKGQPWNVDFSYDGRPLTGSSSRNTAYITVETANSKSAYMREQLDLTVGECVYGFGERFTSLVKNGQVVETWNHDGGTGSEQAYKSIPFYITNKGYGVLVNHPEQVSFEVASEHVKKVQFSVPGEELDYYIIGGQSMKQVLEHYTRLTGKPALPPAWSFGLWLSTSFTTDYDEKTVTHFVDGMAERDLPLSVFHFDSFWMKGLHWCDFEWDADIFPDPEGMLQRLKQKGLKICLWINPYVGQRSQLFEEGKRSGYFLRRANGDVWQRDEWQPAMAIVDFTNPAACTWYISKLKRLLAMGVDCFKTDFGERIPTDVVYFDGSDPVKMHNYYAFIYNKRVFDLLEEQRGCGEAVLFARSATVGSQQFPVHWGGDSSASYESMAESLRGGLSFGLSGFGFWSHDIGGFENTSTADVYKRWIAFGLLSSHSRLHGSQSYRVPWSYDEEASDVLRFFTKLKSRLMPYLYATACQATHSGLPMMRAMVLEFEGDPACEYLDRQYMIGEALLVAPVFSEQGQVSCYLPRGTWTNFLTGERVEGNTWRQEQHGYLSIPLYVRPDSIVALGQNEHRPDYDYTDNVELHVFELQDEHQASTIVYNQQGQPALHIQISRQEKMLTIHAEGVSKPCTILLRGIATIVSVEGAEYHTSPLGVRIELGGGVEYVEVELF